MTEQPAAISGFQKKLEQEAIICHFLFEVGSLK
jgi:hypothetical protein